MKKQTRWQLYFINVAIGMGITVGILLALCFIIAIVFAGGGLSDRLCAILVYSALCLSWGLGGLVSGFRNRKDGLLTGAIHGITLFLVLVLISIFTRTGDTSFWGIKLLVYFLGGILVSGIGSVIGVHMALKKDKF